MLLYTWILLIIIINNAIIFYFILIQFLHINIYY